MFFNQTHKTIQSLINQAEAQRFQHLKQLIDQVTPHVSAPQKQSLEHILLELQHHLTDFQQNYQASKHTLADYTGFSYGTDYAFEVAVSDLKHVLEAA